MLIEFFMIAPRGDLTGINGALPGRFRPADHAMAMP